MKQMNQHIPCIKTALFLAFYIFYLVVEKVLMWRSSVGLGMKTRLPMFWLRGKVVFKLQQNGGLYQGRLKTYTTRACYVTRVSQSILQ